MVTPNQDYFGEEIAAHYDDDQTDPDELRDTVELLAELAGGGSVLEFAIGTGRIGLPLAERGVPVHGIELSRAMVARLRAKPGGSDIPVEIGDMSTVRTRATYRLVYLVFNTIGNLTTQDAQVACFRNAAAHLEPGGFFLIETGVPQLRRVAPGESTRVFERRPHKWGIDEYDFARQGLVSHHLHLVDGRFEVRSIPFRYVWPAELDLMAQLAGMHLRDRWGDWDRRQFTSESRKHVSIWELPSSGSR
jgi:SAM-dependent methyltransferase